MEQAAPPQAPRAKLGSQGLEVSKLGFGCMGLTGSYNAPLGDEAVAAVVEHAFRRGVTFFDTSDAYGPHTNETLLGRALGRLPRGQVQVATKFGIGQGAAGGLTVCGEPEYVRACCEASLRRLGVSYIDLYYQHRVDITVPIEDTVALCSQSAPILLCLLRSNWCSWRGCSCELLCRNLCRLVSSRSWWRRGRSSTSACRRRARTRSAARTPCTPSVQMEWSLWSRDIEPEIVPLCR